MHGLQTIISARIAEAMPRHAAVAGDDRPVHAPCAEGQAAARTRTERHLGCHCRTGPHKNCFRPGQVARITQAARSSCSPHLWPTLSHRPLPSLSAVRQADIAGLALSPRPDVCDVLQRAGPAVPSPRRWPGQVALAKKSSGLEPEDPAPQLAAPLARRGKPFACHRAC